MYFRLKLIIYSFPYKLNVEKRKTVVWSNSWIGIGDILIQAGPKRTLTWNKDGGQSSSHRSKIVSQGHWLVGKWFQRRKEKWKGNHHKFERKSLFYIF